MGKLIRNGKKHITREPKTTNEKREDIYPPFFHLKTFIQQ